MNQVEVGQFLQKKKNVFSDSVRLFIEWNESYHFQTKAFEWLYGNVTVLAAVEDNSMDQILLGRLMDQTFLDVLSFFKDENERKKFQSYTNISPLFSS